MRTDGHDEADSRFLRFCETPPKILLSAHRAFIFMDPRINSDYFPKQR